MIVPGRIGPALLLVAAAGCAGGPTGPGSFVPHGTWGGEHVRLTIDAVTAAVEFDCAHGTLPAPIPVDGGRFDLEGVFVLERGGPIRVDEELPRRRARYSGIVEGDRMTLRVALTDPPEDGGSFTLRLGAAGLLRKCL